MVKKLLENEELRAMIYGTSDTGDDSASVDGISHLLQFMGFTSLSHYYCFCLHSVKPTAPSLKEVSSVRYFSNKLKQFLQSSDIDRTL